MQLTAASSGSLTGLWALWKKPNENLLMCEHNAASYLSFSALLLAFVDIIPHPFGIFYGIVIVRMGEWFLKLLFTGGRDPLVRLTPKKKHRAFA